ncbi:MAG: exodeoxyribonuclease V subunit beta [Methylococcales bacterium]
MNTDSGFQSLTPGAILDFPLSGIHLIEASAGTGKTYTIASLFAHYVLEGIDSHKILVVTFTNAASEELHGRIRARLVQVLMCLENHEGREDAFLEEVLHKYSAPDRRQAALDRLKLAIRTLDEAAIFTIHGFCQRVLTDHAFNSGQAYDTELTTDENELWNQALEDWWRIHAYPLNPEQLTLFLLALESLDRFSELQRPLRVIQPPSLVPRVGETLEELYRGWDVLKSDLQALAATWQSRSPEIVRILKESKALSRSQQSDYHNKRLAEMLEKIHDYFERAERPVNPEIIAYLSLDSLDDHSTPVKRGKDPELKAHFFIACQALGERINELVAKFKIRALIEASGFVREQIETAKRKRRIMTYDDQLTRLYEALQDSRGPDFAHNLRQNFPIAMIDEFQDTDAVQYGIFRTIYGDANATALTLIGDPKQSIYRFRGSDIFTYMQARRDAGNAGYTLDTNWRSTPGLIRAVNAIFEFRVAPFIYHEAIAFFAVSPADSPDPSKDRSHPFDDRPAEAPLTIWKIPLNEEGKPFNKGPAQELLSKATASQIAKLLTKPKPAKTKASDIAVLVRTQYEGQAIQAALRERGIASVSIAKDKLYHSEEAGGLEMLLVAIAESGNRQAMRNALASSLLNLTYPEMDRIRADEEAWQAWSDNLKHLGELWRHKGFMAMFHHLLDSQGIGESIAHRGNAERRLTNLMHLAELLQEASKQHPEPSSLLAWFDRQRRQSGIRESEPRLESDEDLVRIVTIHSSKGLEYPVVFLPFVWSAKPIRDTKTNLIEYHDQSGKAWLDAGSSPETRKKAHCLAEKERLAEDLRLLYVALTRARSKIYLAWGRVNANNQDLSGQSALAYLLHSRQSAEDLDHALPAGFAAGNDLDADLQRLLQDSGGNIEICELPESDSRPEAVSEAWPDHRIEVSEFKGRIATDWRIASFTGLTRDVHQPAQQGSPRILDDPIMNFPAGSRTGSFLHLILENLDFQGPLETQAQALWQRFAPRFNFDSSTNPEIMTRWLGNIVNTRLNPRGLRLKDLPMTKRLNELEFDFSLRHVEISALNRVLHEHAGRALEAIETENFQGIVNGVIDLIFAHEGRYYIADYKTNYLGGSLDDYLPEKLADAIFDRRYDLQYLLYTLALHRYLKQRIAGYRYTEHVGGVYYLFLRAMRPEDTHYRGIFQVMPDQAVVESLDEIVFVQPLRQALHE